MSERYPLIRSLGLYLEAVMHREGFGESSYTYRVNADELERVLEQAPVVYARKLSDDSGWHHFNCEPWSTDTHFGRVLCVQPIVKDTAESLLRELVDLWCHTSYSAYDGPTVTKLANRARALLEGK